MTLETIMNIEALKTFLVVAEVKNFTKAAQQLFVVQSTITNRIKELEKEDVYKRQTERYLNCIIRVQLLQHHRTSFPPWFLYQ